MSDERLRRALDELVDTGGELETVDTGDELMPGVVSHATALSIEVELGFNEWKRLGETLQNVTERGVWALGDHRVYGDRYEADYPDGVAAYDASSRHVRECAQVARAFPRGERSPHLTWFHHLVLVTVRDHRDRLRWLSAAERGGWSARELADRLKEGRRVGERPHALQLRPIGDVVERLEQRAAALGRPVRDLALEVLELAAQLDDPVAALEAAGAKRELEAVSA